MNQSLLLVILNTHSVVGSCFRMGMSKTPAKNHDRIEF